MSNNDVDRLFQCFKCGISPPQSAFRETRRSQKRKLKSASPLPINSSNKKKIKPFSPLVFYGSPNGVPPKRPARLLRLLHEIRVDLAKQIKLSEEVWKTFPRQEEAIKFMRMHDNVRVFSYEDRVKGQRRFLVSSYHEFWRRYRDMNPKIRHHYEIIQEGLPCHLYFDLEFSRKENADSNGDEMVDLLITVIFDALLEKYSVQGTHDLIVELDSSTEELGCLSVVYAEKFSRHLVIRLPKTAFKDNLHVGAFVAEICSRIQSYRERDENFGKLFISKSSSSGDNHCQLFVDTAVYSRNRCFRLPFSSKAGKTSILIPSGRFKCKDMSEKEVFMASLICNLDADTEKLLLCKMDMDCVKSMHFGAEVNDNIERHPQFPQNLDLNICQSDASTTYVMGKSPFPALDVFVEAIASRGSVSGKIRSWYWFSEYWLMVYSMSRSRYCERIGREHKSNHVDVRRSVYYQKCHDPDCRGYRSPLRSVPDDAIPDLAFSVNAPGESEDQGQTSPAGDQSITDSCGKEWWQEAIKVAEQVDNIQRALDLTKVEEDMCEEDEMWWRAVVESTEGQTESICARVEAIESK